MSTPAHPITRKQAQLTHKWPCDGIARYSVKGAPSAGSVVYSCAYDMVFLAGGGTLDGEGKRTFAPDALRRIAKLNAQYTRIAIAFIDQAVKAELLVAYDQAESAAKPETTPEPETNAVPVPKPIHFP
jgi:hypothetical protein